MNEHAEPQGIYPADPVVDLIQSRAKALGDPTRYRLFRHIVDAHSPVYIDELAELVAVNHNAVRQHLAVLKEAQLVAEELEKRSKPGRPRLQYSLNPDTTGTWGTESPYQTVAILLTDVIKTGRTALEVGRNEGRRRARGLSNDRDLLQMLNKDLRMGGFQPTSIPSEGGHDFVLQKCPYEEVATLDPHTICQLHQGLVEGITGELDKKATVRLVVRDPKRAGCCVKVRSLAG